MVSVCIRTWTDTPEWIGPPQSGGVYSVLTMRSERDANSHDWGLFGGLDRVTTGRRDNQEKESPSSLYSSGWDGYEGMLNSGSR